MSSTVSPLPSPRLYLPSTLLRLTVFIYRLTAFLKKQMGEVKFRTARNAVPKYMTAKEPSARDFSIRSSVPHGCVLLPDTGYPIFRMAHS